MIVCYFYISCQIHLVCPWSGRSRLNSKHPAPCLPTPPPPQSQREWACVLCRLHAADRSAFRLVSQQVQEEEPQCGAFRGKVVTHRNTTASITVFLKNRFRGVERSSKSHAFQFFFFFYLKYDIIFFICWLFLYY